MAEDRDSRSGRRSMNLKPVVGLITNPSQLNTSLGPAVISLSDPTASEVREMWRAEEGLTKTLSEFG
jgi:hypothetical protein